METILYSILGILIPVLLWWVYMCIINVAEDQIKIVETRSISYIKTICGIRGKEASTIDDTANGISIGDLIDGKDSGKYAWHWYGLEFVSTYEMRKIVRKESLALTSEEKSLIVWGDPSKDSEVSVFMTSISNHYRRQYTYEMYFDNIETGRENNASPESFSAQNVKIRVRLNVTTCTKNARKTRYIEGDGGKWLTTLHNIILSCLNELYATKTFDQISDLRARKLNDLILKDGKTVLERINEQMLDVKDLGQSTLDLDFLDYEIMPESKPFADSLQKRAVAAINKATAKDEAEAEREKLKPQVEAKKDLIEAAKSATIEIYNTENVTVVKQTEKLPRNLRVFAGSLYSPTPTTFDTSLPDTREIIKETLAHDIANEISDEDGNRNNNRSTKKRR